MAIIATMMNFPTKRVMFVYIQHIDAMLLCFCLVLDHKCGKNKKVAYEAQPSVTDIPTAF